MDQHSSHRNELKALLGADAVFSFKDEQAAEHKAWLSEFKDANELPFALVFPRSTQHVQAIIKFANDNEVGVMSTPNITGAGASVPTQSKPCILLDMSRMNRILEFDADSAFVLLEPGVTYTDLRSYININELPYWVDSDKNAAHSVCGAFTERAFGNTPYGDRLLMQCGLEVVLGNGQLLRTGMGALPGNNTWQLFKFNFGPYLDGLFSRANNGIITKIGLWMMPAPPAFHPFHIAVLDEQALPLLIEAMRPLKINMTVPNTVVIGDRQAESRLAPQDPNTAAPWQLYGALYGLPNNLELTWQMIEMSLAGLDGIQITSGDSLLTNPQTAVRTALMQGRPAYHEFARPNSISFSASAPIEGVDAVLMKEIVQGVFAKTEIIPSLEFSLTWRTMLLQVEIPLDVFEYRKSREVALLAINSLETAGYAITHDSVSVRESVNANNTNRPLQQFQQRVSAALDPNQVFASR